MSKEYKILDGKLTLDGKPVELIFGDLEQIKVLRKYERLSKELREEGVDVEPHTKIAEFHFNCLCGRQRTIELDMDSKYENHECGHCERKYYIEADNYENYKLYLIQQ
jgi:hypothetical protein